MPIWMLEQSKDREVGDIDPWAPWYDKAFAFVVIAETEGGARIEAHAESGDEDRAVESVSPWLDPKYTTCKELKDSGPPRVVIRDFAAA